MCLKFKWKTRDLKFMICICIPFPHCTKFFLHWLRLLFMQTFPHKLQIILRFPHILFVLLHGNVFNVIELFLWSDRNAFVYETTRDTKHNARKTHQNTTTARNRKIGKNKVFNMPPPTTTTKALPGLIYQLGKLFFPICINYLFNFKFFVSF